MKPYLLSLLLLAPGLALAQITQPFIIKGQVNPKINAPAKAYLFFGDGYLDSTLVKNGQFMLKGKVGAPGKAYVLLSRRGSTHDMAGMGIMHADFKSGFYLEPGTTIFTSPDSLKYAQVVGGLLTTEWQELTEIRKPIVQHFKNTYAEYDATPAAQRKTPEFRQAHAARLAIGHHRRHYLDSLFILAHPASLVSFDIVDGTATTKVDSATARRHFALLAPTLRASPQGQQLSKKIARLRTPVPAVGQPAPEFTLTSATGQSVALSSYRGKYVLVDFWASWCGPCRAENPNVARVYNEYKGRNFDVLGVSIDVPDAREKWLKAVHDDHLPWAQVLDQGGSNRVAARYQVEAIPQNFLIDPSGKIVALNLRGEALRTTLAQFIK